MNLSRAIIFGGWLLTFTAASTFLKQPHQSLKQRIKELVDDYFIIHIPIYLDVYSSPNRWIPYDEEIPGKILTTKINGQELLRFRWPGGIVPVKISSGIDIQAQSYFQNAFNEFQKYTCIRFVEWQPSVHGNSYLQIKAINNDDIPPPRVFIGNVGVETSIIYWHRAIYAHRIASLLHDLMHVLGFVNEQSRPDRDSYETINWENTAAQRLHDELKIYPNITVFGNYDMDSVMHIAAFEFWTNTYPVTWPAHTWAYNLRKGQRDGFSDGDIRKINKMYRCDLGQKERETLALAERRALRMYKCRYEGLYC